MTKLIKIGETIDGVERFHAQLDIGKDSCSFIREDGIIKHWTNGMHGFGFYKYESPVQIVDSMEEMRHQKL